MAYLDESHPDWGIGIYQIETTDAVMGGNGGTANRQALELAKRARDLKENKVDKVAGKQLSTNNYTTTEKNKLANVDFNAMIPIGGIIMWSGLSTAVPINYKICDGSEIGTGTMQGQLVPDLRDKFVIGVSTSKTVKSTGGSFTKVLTEDSLPSHVHNIKYTETMKSNGTGATYTVASMSNYNSDKNTEITGFGQPFDITPPYMALYYIMRII